MMKTILAAGALAVLLAPPAIAQYGDHDRGGPPRAILFSKPGFQGRSLVVSRAIGKLDHFGFDDKPSSIMIKGGGAWSVCVDDHFGGHCEIIDRSIPDLAMIHMDNRISSIEPIGPGPGTPPPRGY